MSEFGSLQPDNPEIIKKKFKPEKKSGEKQRKFEIGLTKSSPIQKHKSHRNAKFRDVGLYQDRKM